MTIKGNSTTDSCCTPALALVLAVTLINPTPASAEGSAAERTRLAALVRQLDLLERTAHHSASLVKDEHARYHFDYPRLQQDIERIRAGIQDYLTPPRAQPRDPVVLIGEYRREAVDAEPAP